MSDDCYSVDWVPRDGQLYAGRKKKSRNRSRVSVDWWLEGFSGELWRIRRFSYDSISGEIPKTGSISSTPSMRRTVCYVAPEPLQVTLLPMSDFQRANLLSWARNLACAGKLLGLVDQNIQSLNKEQALLCITMALLYVQKSPVHRPSMKELVAMLCGDLESPQLPVEFSPSLPPASHLSRTRNFGEFYSDAYFSTKRTKLLSAVTYL
ncbi:Receptor-like serine/threonine-protein kinase [Abeliophyllum distichum]|uniref:Receptor-like serine/threonine-protein kinase n=1 Tax=Abeliophyllum distichum TaxID=126358 RepID=A0ABD1VRV1_9LAMI